MNQDGRNRTESLTSYEANCTLTWYEFEKKKEKRLAMSLYGTEFGEMKSKEPGWQKLYRAPGIIRSKLYPDLLKALNREPLAAPSSQQGGNIIPASSVPCSGRTKPGQWRARGRAREEWTVYR